MPDGVQPSDGDGSQPPKFDAFIAYNSQDEAASMQARWIWEALEDNGHRTWFAEHDVSKGAKFVSKGMEQGIADSACCLVLIGEKGLGNWQGTVEYEIALARSTKDKDFRVLSVLLPDSTGAEELRPVMKISSTVDLADHFKAQGLTEDGLTEVLCTVRNQSRREFEEERAKAVGAGGYHALLVGISKYEDADLGGLMGPPNDLRMLASALAAVEPPSGGRWGIDRCSEPDREDFGRRTRDFFLKASDEDTLFFYYSGHGTISKDEAYLCTGTSKLRSPAYDSIAAAELARWVKESPAKAIVVILDCCRGATLNANAYDDLGDTAAVLLASRGLAADAESESDPSPFTKELLGALKDPSVPGEGGLTVGDLVDALGHRDAKPVVNARLAAHIALARRPAKAIEHVVAKTSHVTPLMVEADCFDPDRLRIVRQLADTLDGLLAAEREAAQVPSALVTETMRMLAGELRGALIDEEKQSLDQALREETLSMCAVQFADSAAAAQLGDLPWEYLALHADAKPADLDQQAVLRHPPLCVERYVEVSPGPKGPGVTVQKVELFSSLFSPEAGTLHPLTAATKKQLEELGIRMSPGPSSSWNVFSMAQDDADIVILQCPVRLQGGRLEMLFEPEAGSTTPVSAQQDNLARKLKDRSSMTTLLIETIADGSSNQTALALRRLARSLAESLRCPAVAVCHSRAYARCPGDYPNEPVFMATLVKGVRSGLPLDQAAHAARCEVVTSLVTDPAIVGIPIVTIPTKPGEGHVGRDEHQRRPQAFPSPR